MGSREGVSVAGKRKELKKLRYRSWQITVYPSACQLGFKKVILIYLQDLSAKAGITRGGGV